MTDSETPVQVAPVRAGFSILPEGDEWWEGEGDETDKSLGAIHELICSGVDAYPALAADLTYADQHPLLRMHFQPIWDELQRRAKGAMPECTPASMVHFLAMSLMSVEHPQWPESTRFAVAYVVFKGTARLHDYNLTFKFSDLVKKIKSEQAELVAGVP